MINAIDREHLAQPVQPAAMMDPSGAAAQPFSGPVQCKWLRGLLLYALPGPGWDTLRGDETLPGPET